MIVWPTAGNKFGVGSECATITMQMACWHKNWFGVWWHNWQLVSQGQEGNVPRVKFAFVMFMPFVWVIVIISDTYCIIWMNPIGINRMSIHLWHFSHIRSAVMNTNNNMNMVPADKLGRVAAHLAANTVSSSKHFSQGYDDSSTIKVLVVISIVIKLLVDQNVPRHGDLRSGCVYECIFAYCIDQGQLFTPMFVLHT